MWMSGGVDEDEEKEDDEGGNERGLYRWMR